MKRKRRKKRSCDFEPSRDEVNLAVREYLANGGKITRIEINEPNDETREYECRFASKHLSGGWNAPNRVY